MMNKILNIAWKDTLVKFSVRTEILFFLVLPLFFTFLLGGGVPMGEEDDGRIPLLLVNEDGTALAAQLKDALKDTVSLDVNIQSRENALTMFDDEKAAALVIIPEGYEAALLSESPVELEFQIAPNHDTADAAEQAVLAALNKASRPIAVANASLNERERIEAFQNNNDRVAYFAHGVDIAEALFEKAPDRVDVVVPEFAVEESGDEFDGAAHASAGQLITWVFIPLLGTSGLLAYERTVGTLRRLLTTPTRAATFLLGSITGQLSHAIIQMTLLLIFAIFVMGVNWDRDPVALVVLLLVFAISSIAFGIMLGAFAKTEGQASTLSIALGMTMALLGGCWYPGELFPEAAQLVTKFFPTGWAMQGMTDIVIRGQGLIDVLPAIGVLLAFAVVFFTIGVWRFRYE
jgi:ABC-2 type transport system permease protein